jgi:hypothetical protein
VCCHHLEQILFYFGEGVGIKLKGGGNRAKFVFTFCFLVITNEPLSVAVGNVEYGMELEAFHT